MKHRYDTRIYKALIHHSKSPHAWATTITVFVVAASVLTIVSLGVRSVTLSHLWEHSVFFLFPTSERAYAYGSRHLDTKNYYDYDLDRAEFFLQESLRLNPLQHYAHHQLGRIEFLRGNLTGAIAHLDIEIQRYQLKSASSYYVRGLVKGYQDDFKSSAEDYEVYLRSDPYNWAALNDYAWVLLKSGRSDEALVSLDWGLMREPSNPWLLNSKAVALFDLKEYEKAMEASASALRSVTNVTEADWIRAYPGNDPLIAGEGVQSLRQAIKANMHRIRDAELAR
ncbi:hypothetical protein EBR66_04845 [bacterium]|nr:hypothetical protein [bacterium]